MKKHTARCEHHKDGPDFCTVGIDVSKHHLDACELPSGREARFSNTREGVRAFAAWVCPRVARVVYESTGSYHLLLEDRLTDRLPLSRINPRRGKRFAEALGSEAKTDRADALVLAKMGRAMADDLMETPVRTRREKDPDELRAARDAVTKSLTVLTGRREHARNRLVRREIEKDIARAKRQIGRLDQELERLVATDAELSRKVALLETIPGIARTTAIGLLRHRAAGGDARTGYAQYARGRKPARPGAPVQRLRQSARETVHPGWPQTSAHPAVQANTGRHPLEPRAAGKTSAVQATRQTRQGRGHGGHAKNGGDGECHDPGRQALATGSHTDADPQRGMKGTPDRCNRFATTTPSTCHRSLSISLKPAILIMVADRMLRKLSLPFLAPTRHKNRYCGSFPLRVWLVSTTVRA